MDHTVLELNRGPFLVTGAAGYVGSHLVKLLSSRGVEVRAFVRNLDGAKKLAMPGVELFTGDLKDNSSIDEAVRGMRGVFHIAALFRQAGLPDSEYYDVNLEGTRRLLNASISHAVPRFVYCSTIGVQGHIENPPATEEHPYRPGDVYQRSKMEAEKLVLQTFAQNKIAGAVIRPAMIYGPGDRRLLKLFSMIAHERFFYVGKGDKFVHFIDVRDLAEAFVAAMSRTALHNQVYTIAGRRAVPLQEAVRIIAEKLTVAEPWIHVPVKPMQWLGDIVEAICTPLKINPPIYRRRVDFFTKNRHFDCSKARRDLGFMPKQTLEEEISDIIASYRAEGLLPRISSAHAIIVRNMEGRIQDWNALSEKTYGYSRRSALGNVSHQLLKTEFPYSLDEINKQLVASGAWEGHLVHTTQNGGRLRVHSRWRIESEPGKNEVCVVEVNEPDSEHKAVPVHAAFTLQKAVGGLICPFNDLPGIAA